jgi:hypothetical protein
VPNNVHLLILDSKIVATFANWRRRSAGCFDQPNLMAKTCRENRAFFLNFMNVDSEDGSEAAHFGCVGVHEDFSVIVQATSYRAHTTCPIQRTPISETRDCLIRDKLGS